MWNDFSPKTALHYAAAIALPRLVGSAGEAAVADELAQQLTAFGYEVQAQTFMFSTAVNMAVVLHIGASLALILVSLAAHALHPWAPALPALLLLGLLLGLGPILRSAEQGALLDGQDAPFSIWARLGARHTARNLIARLPGPEPDDARPHLVVMAHYDSKSQRLPIVLRLVLVVLAAGGGAAFALLTLVSPLIVPAMPAAIVAGGLALAAGAPLLWMDWENCSPGAIDNASGIGLALHLAEALARRPMLAKRLHWSILLTDAEELALMGAAAYIRRHWVQLKRLAASGRLYILNLDGVGVEGTLYYDDQDQTSPGRLAALIRRAGDEVGRPVPRFGLICALFDHMPFARRGLDAVTLLAIGRATWAVHTPRDTADKLDVRGFERAARVVIRVVELLAKS